MAGQSPVTLRAPKGPALVPLGHHTGKPPIPLHRPVTVMGSRSNARIHLTSKSVSKAHALIVKDGPAVYVRDLASRTHVFVNGEQIRERNLEPGDQIKIGSFTFKFFAPAALVDEADIRVAAPAKLDISGGDFPVPLDERVQLIGRRPTCDIPLLEESVSTAHAVIFQMNGQHHVRDLGSRTGTFVNGVSIHQHPLNIGDTIRIGETTLTYRAAASTAQMPAIDDFAADEAIEEEPADELAVEELSPPEPIIENRRAAMPLAETKIESPAQDEEDDLSPRRGWRKAPASELPISEPAAVEDDFVAPAESEPAVEAEAESELHFDQPEPAATDLPADDSADEIFEEAIAAAQASPPPLDFSHATEAAPPEEVGDGVVDEVIESTEPTVESALEAVDRATEEVPVEPPAIRQPLDIDASLDALSDTGLSRAVNDLADGGGAIVEEEAEPAAEGVTPNDVPSHAPPAALAAETIDTVVGANQENYLGGAPLELPALELEAEAPSAEAPALHTPAAQSPDEVATPNKVVFDEPVPPAAVAPSAAAAKSADANRPANDVDALVDEMFAHAPAGAPTADDLLGPSGADEHVDLLADADVNEAGRDLLQPEPEIHAPVVDEAPSEPLIVPAPHVPPAHVPPPKVSPPHVPPPPGASGPYIPPQNPGQSRPVIPIPPPNKLRGRRKRRGAEAPEAAPVARAKSPRADERIPPFRSDQPATAGAVTVAFDGLAMPPVRETDVFSQMSPQVSDDEEAAAENENDIALDPFTAVVPSPGALTPMELVEAENDVEHGVEHGVEHAQPPVRRPLSGRANVGREVFNGATEQSPPTAASSAPIKTVARPTNPNEPLAAIDESEVAANGAASAASRGASPESIDAQAALLRQRRLRTVSYLIGAMVLVWGVCMAAIGYLFPVGSVVEAPLKFDHFTLLNTLERHQFEDEQQALLASDMTRRDAKRMLSQNAPQVGPGFLDDNEKYLATATLAGWSDAHVGVMTLRYKGPADVDNSQRMLAIAQALAAGNATRINDAARAKQQYQDLEDGLNKAQQQEQQIAQEMDKLRVAADASPDPQTLATLADEVKALDKSWSDAVAATKACQAELAQLKQSTAAGNGDAAQPAANANDANGIPADQQIQALEIQLKDLSAKMSAAQAAKTQQAAAAKQALDASLEDFQKQIADTKQVMQGSPELSAYVAAAQKLQETTRSLIDDLIRRQEQQYSRLNELKTTLVEKMEARRAEQFQADPQLKDLNERLETAERQYNAALSSGLQKESDDKKAEVDLLKNMIQSKQDMMPNDAVKDYAETIAQLQQIIDVTQKNVEDDRQRTDQLVEELQKSFKSSESVEKLPEAEKSVATDLDKRLADINAARQKYNAAISATADDQDDATKQLRTQVATLQANIDARKKALADASQKTVSDEEAKARQAKAAEKEKQLADLKKTESDTQLAYTNKEKDLRDAQAAAQAARDSRDQLDELQNKKAELDRQIEQARRDEPAKKDAADRVINPIPPSLAEITTVRDDDRRPTYWLSSSAAILLIFASLLLLNLHKSHKEMAPPEISRGRRGAASGASDPSFDPFMMPAPNAPQLNGSHHFPSDEEGDDPEDSQPAIS